MALPTAAIDELFSASVRSGYTALACVPPCISLFNNQGLQTRPWFVPKGALFSA